MKAFTLCEQCSKEIEVPILWREEQKAYYTAVTSCPYCKAFNVIFVKIVVTEDKVKSR